MTRPALLAFIGIALLSFMDAIIKALVVRLPVIEVAAVRYAVGSLVMVLIAAAFRPGWPTAETLRANGARALVVVVTAVSFFYALGQLPLAETLILSFISPSVTALFAVLILKERLDRRILGALAAGFAGVIVIVAAGLGDHGTAPGGNRLAGVVAVLIASVGYSASNVLLRARAQRDPLVTIVLIQNVAPGLILLGPAAYVWTVPSASDAMALLCVGCLGVAGHLFLARAYARAEASRLAPLDYTALIWAVVVGLVAFDEVPTIWAGLGGTLIMGSAFLASRR